MPMLLDLTPISDPRGILHNPLTTVLYGAILCVLLLWLVRRWRAKRDGQ